MRLSDAIMLGSTMIKWVSGIRHDDNGGGCAVGMAEVATGRKVEDSYSWFSEGHSVPIWLPCGCTAERLQGSCDNILPRSAVQSSYICTLVHLFNYHVMKAKDWTLEQVCDWLRSVEPAEPVIEKPATESVEAVQ